MEYKDSIRIIDDFPKEGISFKDITTLIKDGEGLRKAVDDLVEFLKDKEIDVVVGPEARGFIFGVPVAYALGVGFVPVRKKGKLPCKTTSVKYDLEYGSAEIEIHTRSIKPGDKVVIVDDLMATAGTAKAMVELIEGLGGEVVCILCLMELEGLNGRAVLEGYDVESIIKYPGN